MSTITTRKAKKEQKEKEYEGILDEIPPDYETMLEETNNNLEDSINISRNVPSSTQNKFDRDPMKEVTLEMIYLEMRGIRSDLSSKIDKVKDDIFSKIQKENEVMKKRLMI